MTIGTRGWSGAGLLIGLLLALPACGGEAVAGGQRDVQVDATGDGPAAAPARAPDATAARRSLATAAAVQGTVGFIAAVRLVEGAAMVPVGSAPGRVVVRADGGDTARVATGRVPTGGYSRARLVFREVSADVTGGLTVGGVAMTGHFVVDIPPGDSVVVERPITVPAGRGRIELLTDLNAATWLAAAGPLRRIPAAVFRDAVQLRVR